MVDNVQGAIDVTKLIGVLSTLDKLSPSTRYDVESLRHYIGDTVDVVALFDGNKSDLTVADVSSYFRDLIGAAGDDHLLEANEYAKLRASYAARYGSSVAPETMRAGVERAFMLSDAIPRPKSRPLRETIFPTAEMQKYFDDRPNVPFDVTTPSKHYLLQFAEKIDLRKIVSDARVVFFPDVHDKPQYKQLLIRHMAGLKAAGITHLVVECLPHDAEVSSLGVEELRDLLKRFVRAEWHGQLGNFEGVLREAIKQGLIVRGLNVSEHDAGEETAQTLVERQNNGQPMSYQLHDVVWAQRIKKLLESGGNIAVFAGRAHTTWLNDTGRLNSYVTGEVARTGLPIEQMKVFDVVVGDERRVDPDVFDLLVEQDAYVPWPTGKNPAAILTDTPNASIYSTLAGLFFVR